MSETQAQQIEESLATIAACGNAKAVDAARSLLQAVLGLHRVGLSKIIELVQRRGGADRTLLEELGRDDLVSNLLLLHDLHPISLERRLADAIAEATPRIEPLGGHVDQCSIEKGVVMVRVGGLLTGSATMAARLIVEEVVLKYAPDAAGLKFSGDVEPREAALHGQDQGLITLRIPPAARHGAEKQS